MNPKVIAEIAKEHNGDFVKATCLIEDAGRAGAHSVKFQTYELKDLNPKHINAQRYAECHLSMDKILQLNDFAHSKGLDFYVSSFTKSQLPTLAKHFDKIKIPSTFLTYSDFVKLALDLFKEVHISTGMHDFEMVIRILDYYKDYIAGRKTILVPYHCVSLYPTPPNNLRIIRVHLLRNRYGVVGYSDHSIGNRACILASHYGADFIEKHYSFTGVHKPWCWTEETLMSFKNSLNQEAVFIADNDLTEQERTNYEFYKEEFTGIQKCHLRLLT